MEKIMICYYIFILVIVIVLGILFVIVMNAIERLAKDETLAIRSFIIEELSKNERDLRALEKTLYLMDEKLKSIIKGGFEKSE